MLIIGLTGCSGSGKGFVAGIFSQYGVPSIDTDRITHEIYSQDKACIDEITEKFGTSVRSTDGSVNRKALARIVFADKSSLEALNSISHKHILAHCEREIHRLEMLGKTAVLVDAPQLFESRFNEKCDKIIAVVCQDEVCIDRIISRDKIEVSDALARFGNQHNNEFFISHSDYVIYNNPNDDVKSQVEAALKSMRLI